MEGVLCLSCHVLLDAWLDCRPKLLLVHHPWHVLAFPHTCNVFTRPHLVIHRCEDDLTFKLAEIIRANNALKRQEQNGAPQHIINEFSQLVQYHITTYFDNTLPGQAPSLHKSGRAIKSISQRLKV